jgi:hypothetical protein
MFKLLTLDDVVRYYRNPTNARAEMYHYKWPSGMKCECGSVDFYPPHFPSSSYSSALMIIAVISSS